jgi:hypothetical protein
MSLIVFLIDLKSTVGSIYKTSLALAFDTPQNPVRRLKILNE